MTITAGTAGPGPQPQQRIVFADGLGVASAIDDSDGVDKPCLIFQFNCPPDRPQIPPIKLLIPPADLRQLAEHVPQAIESALLHSGVAERPKAKCAGSCGRILWDEMATRGICRDCQPTDPPAEQPVDEQIDALQEAADLETDLNS